MKFVRKDVNTEKQKIWLIIIINCFGNDYFCPNSNMGMDLIVGLLRKQFLKCVVCGHQI